MHPLRLFFGSKQVLFLLSLALLLAGMPLLLQPGLRSFDADEWQHAQMTWLIAQGRVEPPRLRRRPIGLGHAAMAGASSWA